MPTNKKISPEQLESAIMDILQEYEQQVVEGTKDAVESAGKVGLQIARASAQRIGRGKYAKSLALEKTSETGRVFRLGASVTIYSKQYRIAHLLEHGHVVKNKNGDVIGTARAFPHFRPAEEKSVAALEKKIKQVIGGTA